MLPLVLAQLSNPEPKAVADWMQITFYVVATIVTIAAGVKMFIRSPSADAVFVSREEFDRRMKGMSDKLSTHEQNVASGLKAIFDRLDSDKSEILNSGAERERSLSSLIRAESEARANDTKDVLYRIGTLEAGKVDKK